MHRFFCTNLPAPTAPGAAATTPPNLTVELPDDEAHHARRVLRLQPGDGVELFDGRGNTASGTLQQGGFVSVTSTRSVAPPSLTLHVAVAIPKGPRADDMVNQLSQLGVDRLIPLRAERSVTEPRDRKLDKFQRIAVESAKQSGRAFLMNVAPSIDFADALALDHDTRFIADPAAAPAPPTQLTESLRAARAALVLIGPEGGWTPDELALARQHRCQPFYLGPHILRIETAAAAAAAILRFLAPR